MTPSEQAAVELAQRGTVSTRRGFYPAVWHGTSNRLDMNVRVPPDGPFDRAWEGIQRVNELSKVGTKHAAFYGAYPNNPFRTYQENNARIQQNNQAAFSFGAGPVTAQIQDDYTQAYWTNQATAPSPGILQTLLRRLRG